MWFVHINRPECASTSHLLNVMGRWVGKRSFVTRARLYSLLKNASVEQVLKGTGFSPYVKPYKNEGGL